MNNSGASTERMFAQLAARPVLQKRGDPGASSASDEALGRSRGGLSKKIHILCDSQGHPLQAHLSAGQAHESSFLTDLLENCDVRGDESDAAVHPVALAGDKGYRADWIDQYLLDRGIRPVIPSKSNEDLDSRPVEFDREQYRQWNIDVLKGFLTKPSAK